MTKRVKINIETKNAAFDDGSAPQEVARILRELANRLETANHVPEVLRCYDVNGNHVGQMVAK